MECTDCAKTVGRSWRASGSHIFQAEGSRRLGGGAQAARRTFEENTWLGMVELGRAACYRTQATR